MSDYLDAKREEGIEAALRIVEDYAIHRRDDHLTATQEFVEAIRIAVENDTKSNYHLLERIGLLAIMGFESVSDPSKITE